MAGLSHITDAEATDIDGEFANMHATFQTIKNPPSITVVRQGGTVVGTFDPVSIKMANRRETVTGAGTPVSTTEMDGALKLWTEDVTATFVRRGDRFLWNGQACVISTPPNQKLGGVTEYGFMLQGRNQ